MRLTWRLLPVLLGFAIGPGVPVAHAQTATAEVCPDDAECTRLANQAGELSAMGLLNDAQRVYESAYKRRGDPKLLYERGRVLQKLGRYVDAAICYRKYLELDTSGNEKQRRKTEQYLDESLQQAQDTPAAPRLPEPVPPPVTPPSAPAPSVLPPGTPLPAAPPAAATVPADGPATAATAPAAATAPTTAAAPTAASAPAKVTAPVKVAVRLPIKSGPPPRPKKIWQKWWFWTAIGAGVAATGIGLGLGFGLASRQPDLTGVTTFHPFGN